MTAFDDCLRIVLKEEGGYVDNPQDPGGRTNLGVTQRVWEGWVDHPVNEAVMRSLTPSMVAPLYRAQYWNAISGDGLPMPLALAVFDFAVNAGVGRAARFLQMICGAAADGHIGPGTIAAVNQAVAIKGMGDICRRFMNARRDYYRSLKNFPIFGRGWLNRCDRIEAECNRRISCSTTSAIA